MRFRQLILDNLSWKLLSLGLAVLIWYGAHLFMGEEIRPRTRPLPPYGTRDFPSLAVRILTPGNTAYPVEINPPHVFVRIGGDLTILDRLTDDDPIAYVEMPEAPITAAITNRVELHLAPSLRLLSAIPEQVVITPAPPLSPSTPSTSRPISSE